MQFSKTSILGLVVIMVTQATSRPVELNSQVQAEATPWTTLTCTYSYNALYDWYVIKGEGFNFRENNANREIKKCAEKAGAFTGWLQRNTADTDGAIDVQVSFLLRLLVVHVCTSTSDLGHN